MKRKSKTLSGYQAGKNRLFAFAAANKQGKNAKTGIGKHKLIPALIIAVIMVYFVTVNLRSSVFFTKKDRINIVYSADKSAFYSLGLSDNVNYFIPFFSDLEVIVPGGYGYYRIGALNKLADLEKDPDILRKTYSAVTSSMVDFYFYPPASESQITYGKERSGFFEPDLKVILFGKTNAGFFDRIYLLLKFVGKGSNNFKFINSLSTDDQGKRITFLTDEFFESLQGIFYRKAYRNEKLEVQIIYTNSYKTAYQLSQVLEGEGIRVVDLTSIKNSKKDCTVLEELKPYSETAKSVSQFFGCQLREGKTEAYDIIVELGEAEKEWEID